MEMWVSAGVGGRVAAVHAKVGDQIELGALLVELELASDPATTSVQAASI